MTANNSGFRFDTNDLQWIHYESGPRFDYPIDYDIAVLGHQEDIGRLDLLIRWAPDAYCHFHRHEATTTSLVLDADHNILAETTIESFREQARELAS